MVDSFGFFQSNRKPQVDGANSFLRDSTRGSDSAFTHADVRLDDLTRARIHLTIWRVIWMGPVGI